ncbi:MAG: flagellar motor switch phosphatase FliY, partial [Clostridiales bacterium]|nr:flagellar motor switch phosphatase FliY [Clostridiales bacterium]
KMIDISPPEADLVDLTENVDESAIDEFLSGKFVKIAFRMEIGDLVDSEIMQLYPISFAKEMCAGVRETMQNDTNSVKETPKPEPAPAPAQQAAAQTTAAQQQTAAQQPMMDMQMQMGGQQIMSQPMPQPMPQAAPMMGQPMMASQVYGQPMNVQPAQFTAFSGAPVGGYQPENIDLIMDVPLEVTVELGRTSKSISDILDFGPGKIIELNRIAGEPIDVLVNGKHVARGEVVVIEENFGVRITEIVNNVRLVQPQPQ